MKKRKDMTISVKATDTILQTQRDYDRLSKIHDALFMASYEEEDEELCEMMEKLESALLRKLSEMQNQAQQELKRRR